MTNVNKIYEINISGGNITSVQVYIDDLEKYKGVDGYGAPRTAYNIAEFKGKYAIHTILKDIGVGKIELDVANSKFNEYGLLKCHMADNSRVCIDEITIFGPKRCLSDIKKVTLNQYEGIGSVRVGSIAATYYSGKGVIDLSYPIYSLVYAIWGNGEPEELHIERLKKSEVVMTHDGKGFNYYSKYENDTTVVVRRVV